MGSCWKIIFKIFVVDLIVYFFYYFVFVYDKFIGCVLFYNLRLKLIKDNVIISCFILLFFIDLYFNFVLR